MSDRYARAVFFFRSDMCWNARRDVEAVAELR